MKTLRRLVLSGLVVALGACSNFDVHSEIEALNEAQPSGAPFTRHLAEEYRLFSNYEMDQEQDYPDALHFARKGLAVADGTVVMPEPVSDWNLLPRHMTELNEGRARLMGAFDLGAREMVPQPSALAQAKFDCWMEQQEENWQQDDIAACKSEFLQAMNALEGMLVPPPAPEPVAPMVEPEPAPMPPEDAKYLVFFDFDSSEITAAAGSILDAVAGEVRQRSLSSVNVVGHTDRSGPGGYNKKLANRRSNAVRDALAARGVDPAMIRVDGMGEDFRLVETADGVREPANRRAEITFSQ